MQSSKKLSIGVAIFVALTTLGGCASRLIGERPGSDQVVLAEAAQVGKCQSKGGVTVGVMSEVAFYTRSAEAVEDNLLQMARNAAIDSNADTVVKGKSVEFGKRSFDLYKCKP